MTQLRLKKKKIGSPLLSACFFVFELAKKLLSTKAQDETLQNRIEQYLYDSQLLYNDNYVNVFNINFSSDTSK